MTPEMALETVVEYHFECFCGAAIVASEKTVTCTNCGRNFGIRRIGKRTHQRRNTAPHLQGQSVWKLGDLSNLAIYAVVCVLFLFWLYELACG